jgi:hypothetical protein
MMKSRTLDFLAMGSATVVLLSGLGLLGYVLQSKLDPSFEHIIAWKRSWYLILLLFSLAVGLPVWCLVIGKRRRKNRK